MDPHAEKKVPGTVIAPSMRAQTPESANDVPLAPYPICRMNPIDDAVRRLLLHAKKLPPEQRTIAGKRAVWRTIGQAHAGLQV
jgi:hypothetical protein